jgi:hypothetical protein
VNLRSVLERRSVEGLTRAACVLALAALAVMSFSIVSPGVVPVMLAMSLGHLLGALGFCCYLLGVVLDVARSSRQPDASHGATTDHERNVTPKS